MLALDTPLARRQLGAGPGTPTPPTLHREREPQDEGSKAAQQSRHGGVPPREDEWQMFLSRKLRTC